MRELFAFVLAASVMLAGCKKDGDNNSNLASQVTGSYIGSVNLAGTTYENKTVHITKISDTRIHIKPLDPFYSSEFDADIRADGDGIVLTVPPQLGGSLKGATLAPSVPDGHGAYSRSDRKLVYSIILTVNGVEYLEAYYSFKN